MISFVLVLVPSMVNVYSISFVHIARSLVVVLVLDIVIVSLARARARYRVGARVDVLHFVRSATS